MKNHKGTLTLEHLYTLFKIEDNIVYTEIWDSIDNSYMISSFGRVKGLDRYVNARNGKRFEKGKMLRPATIKNGYQTVVLHTNIHKLVHRLVALSFIDNINNKPNINHIDCNTSNNYYKNLEWCTQSENLQHAVNNGLIKCKFSREEILDIRNKVSTKEYKQAEVARLYNTNRANISQIVNFKTYKLIK